MGSIYTTDSLEIAKASPFRWTSRLWNRGNLNATSLVPRTHEHYIYLEPEDFITAFDYLVEKESLLVGTSRGLLLVHNVESDVTELVGNIGGVKCFSPSPTGDLLGLITGLGQLLVMKYDWVLMHERALGDVAEGESDDMALDDHLKAMRMAEGGKRELKSLLICLVTLGEMDSAQTAENFLVSQVAAANDTVSSESVNEEVHYFERYAQKTRSTTRDSDAFSWILITP